MVISFIANKANDMHTQQTHPIPYYAQMHMCPKHPRERERQKENKTWVRIYPVDAKSGRSDEQATSTDVISAAVPSIVFSGKWESYTFTSCNGRH